MLLSKTIVSRLSPKCYLGVTSTRLFSTVRKQPRGFEPKLFQTSHQLNIRSSHIRLLSVTGPKLSENNKEELIFEIPEKPAETVETLETRDINLIKVGGFKDLPSAKNFFCNPCSVYSTRNQQNENNKK